MPYWLWFQHFVRIEAVVLLVLAVAVWGFVMRATDGRNVRGSLFLLGFFCSCAFVTFLVLSFPVALVVWILAG